MSVEPYIGQIQIFAGEFDPKGWATCDGRLIKVRDNTPLFGVLSNRFGGDGRDTFALPDLRGRAAMQPGQVAGLTSRKLGDKGGSAGVALTVEQLSSHRHVANARRSTGTQPSPVGGVWSIHPGGVADRLYSDLAADATLASTALSTAGRSGPHENRQPGLGLRFIIALTGLFPTRS